MKAITIKEPWAMMIALGETKNETRSWRTNYRGWIAIHAAKSMVGSRLENDTHTLADQLLGDQEMPLGAIVAIAKLTDCIEITKEYTESLTLQERTFGYYKPGYFAWTLEDVCRIDTPIKYKGQQGLFNIDERILQRAITEEGFDKMRQAGITTLKEAKRCAHEIARGGKA